MTQASIDGTLEAAAFNNPRSLAKDTLGNIYVGELGAIRKITPDGMVSTLAGSSLSGFLDGTGAEARFDLVWGLDCTPDGTVYAADAFNHAIRAITPDGLVTTIGGDGTEGYLDGINSQFSFPEDVTLDEAGNLYIADGTNSVIRKIDLDGITSTVAGFKYEDFLVGLEQKAI